MEGYRGVDCDRASETSSFLEDEEEEEEEEEEEDEEEEEEAAVDPEEAEELTKSLKDVLQSEDVKPKLQYIMTNPSFSMVTVHSQDSGITWETSSSRSSTPWASETSTTSDLYSMEGSPVGSPPGKVIFIMDEGKIVRKRKRKSSNRVPMATSLKGSQGNKKRDSSGMQRQEPRTVLGDVQGSVLNVGQVETQDTDEEMLDDNEDLEDIAEEPVKRAPIRSIFRESRLRKVGPILGGPVQARIKLFNSIFGGIEPTPETLEKNRIQRSSSVSGDSEQFLEMSVRERLQKFRSLSEAMQRKTFQRARNRNLETPSERRREQRQQPTTYASKSYSSPTTPLEKQLTIKEDVSSENIKPIKMKDKPSRLSSFGAETALKHEERKDRQSLLKIPNQVSGQSLKSCPPEEAKQQQSYSLAARTSITEQSASISLESDAVSEKQVPVPETTHEEQDQSVLTASDLTDEPLEHEIQPNSAPQSVSEDFVNELGRQSTQPILPTASMSEHPEREAQKSAEQSYFANIPSSKSTYSAVSEARQEDIVPQSSEAAQSESEHVLLPCSVDKTEKQETECRSSTTAQTEHSGQLFTVKRNETQKTPLQETENVQFKEQMESEEQGIKVNLPIPQKTDSKYFGMSYPVHTETQETQKTSSVNKGVDLDHPVSSTEETKQVESAQLEMEHPDFSYSSKEIEESEETQMETEHPDFSFAKEETEELESLEHPDFSFSRGEMENSESAQLETEHPDFSYSREETEESVSAKLETDYPELFFSTHEAEALENVQQQTEHPDVSYCKEETEELESAQLEVAHPDFSFAREEAEESESAQLETEHPDFFSKEEAEESESAQLELEHPDFSFSRKEVEESGRTQLETEHPDISYSKGEMVEPESAQQEHPDFSFSREEAEESESAKLETGHPDFFHPRDEVVELESAQLEMEHPDFSYSSKEIGESEETQMETEHPDFSSAKEETEELGSAQLVTEHPDSSFPRAEMEESESARLETEHPDVSYCKEETTELGGAQPETQHLDVFSTEEAEGSESAQLKLAHPDFSFSREEAEESESSKLETEHPDFFHPRDEVVELESAQLEMEHPDFSYSSKEIEESEETQMETEHPDFSSAKEETEELESAQLVMEHPDFSFSRGEMENSESAQLETEHPDVSYCKEETMELGGAQPETQHPDVFSTEEAEGSESAQLKLAHPDFSFSREETEELESEHLDTEHQEFSFSGNETEKPKSVPLELEQPEEGEQGEKAQLPQVPSGVSCFMKEPNKENTTEAGLACPDISNSTRRAEAQQTVYLQTAHSNLPFPTNKSKDRELSRLDVDNSFMSYSGDKGEQPQPVQQDSQPGGKLYSHAKGMQGETTQLWSEHPVLLYSTGKEQQHKTLQLKKEETEITYSTGQTEQQEILQADLPCSHAEAAQEVVRKNLEGPEPTCFISEAEQHENVQLLSENRDLSFTTGEVMRGVEPGSSGSSHLTTRAKTWEMAQLEQEQSVPSCSTAGSQEQETTPLDMVQTDLAYSFGRMEQDVVQGELEQQETVQQNTVQMGMQYSGLSETWGEEETQAIDQITSAQPEAAQTEFVYSSLPYSPSEQMQEEMEIEPAYPGQAFYVSTDMQEERTQVKSEQPFLSSFSGKTEQQEIAPPELEQTFLPPSTGKEAPLEMEVSSEYPELSYSFHKAEQQKKLQHPTLPFRLKQEETAPLVSEPSDFSCDSAEVKPGDTVQQESRHPELSYSMGETEGQAEHLDSPRTLSEAVQDERMEVESKYSKLTCFDGQKTQQKTSQLSSKYPDVSFSFGKAKEQGTQEFESKYRESPKVARKRASPVTAQMESKLPDFTCSLGQGNEPEIAPWEEKHSDLSHHTDETNQQEVSDQKHRKISVGREKQQQDMKQQLEQEKLSHSCGKTEQLKHTQKDLEQPDLSFSIARPADETAPPEADIIHPLDNTEVQQRGQGELKQTGLTCPFGKPEQKTDQSEVAIPCLAQSVSMAGEEEMAEHGQEHPDLPCSVFKAGLLTAQLKPGHPHPAYSLDKVQEMTQAELEQPDVLYFYDKTEQIPPAQLEGGHADLDSPADIVGQEGMEQKNTGHSDDGQPVSRAEHPQAAKEKLEAPDASSHRGKGEQREMAKPEPKHPDLSYSTDQTQTQETTQLGLGKSVLASWPGKRGQAQTAQEEQPGFLYPLKAAEGEKEQSDLGHSQLPSVSETEQETACAKSNRSDLPAGRLEHHEIIQPKPELMDLSCSAGETEQSQVSEVDSDYPYLWYSAGKIQEENIQPEQKQPGDFSSSLSKEQKWEGAGMQVGHPELQGSMGKTGLQSSQSRSEYTDLSLSVGTAEPPKITQAELKEHDLLHSFVKTKSSWAAPLESEHPGVSDATGKVPHPDLSSFASEENQRTQLEVKQERGSDTLHTEETVQLNLEQPMFSSPHGTALPPNRPPLEGEFPDLLYFSGEEEQQEMVKEEMERSSLSYPIDKTQQQETTKLGLGQPDFPSLSGKGKKPQTVQAEAEHKDLLHFTGKTEQGGTAPPEAEHPSLSYSGDKTEQPRTMEWKSEQPVTPLPIGKTEQQGITHPEQEFHNLSYSICKTPSQEAAQMDLEQQDLTYDNGKTNETEALQGELECTGLLYSSDKREQEMVLPELQHPQLSCPIREIVEEAAHQKLNYPDLSFGQEHCEFEQPKVEEMDVSYPAGKLEHSQPAQKVLHPEHLESFGKLEEKGMAQPGFLHSFGEEKQKSASPLDLLQPGLSHSLGNTENQETAQPGFRTSDSSYSTGKAEQLQTEQLKSGCLDLSYSLGKAEPHGMKPLDLPYSYVQAEQPQTVQLEHPETSHLLDEMERRSEAQPELQGMNLQYPVVETEQAETPSASYTFGRTEDRGTAQTDFGQSGLLSLMDKAEKHEAALLKAGLSEKQDTGPASSLHAQLGTKQDLPIATEEAESQPYSSLTEQAASAPLDVSHSVSEIKPEGTPKPSPVTAGLFPKHLDLSYTHCKTEQTEAAQPASSLLLARKEAEKTKIDLHLPMAAQPEAEYAILPETESEQTPHYFHTATQLESKQLYLSYSTDKAETLESQDYLTVSSKLESEPSVPFYSADERCQQETSPYSKPTSEYLVPMWSLAQQEKQSLQPLTPQPAQSECKYVFPPHDEKEVQKVELCSSKATSLKMEQLESMSLMHMQDQDEQESQGHLWDAKYLSSDQLRSSTQFTAKQDNQKIQPEVQTEPRLETAMTKVTGVTEQQAAASDSFVPSHTLPENSVAVVFPGNEEKQSIASSLSKVVDVLGKQPSVISGIYTEGGEDRCEMQLYFADQKHTSSEHEGAASSDLVYETGTHTMQHYSGEQGNLSSAEIKSVSSSSDEKQNPDTSSFGLAGWLVEEVKSHSISPIRAAEVKRQGSQLSPSETSDFGSNKFPAGSFPELRVHGDTNNKGDVFRVSDSVSSEISPRTSSESGHNVERYDLPSLGGDNPGQEKVQKRETRIGNPTKMEGMQQPEVDKMPEGPKHFLRGEEEEMEHAHTVEDSQHAPEPTEQKDLFNIISEGYEILNIHAPTHISSVDQEESKHLPDKLEYLETNPSFKRKLADDGHRALASGTTPEISEGSVLGKPASHELRELVKNYDVEETGETQQKSPTLPENNNNAGLDPNNGMADMDYFEKYTLIDDRSQIKPHFERTGSLFPVTEDSSEPVEEATSFKERAEVDTLEEEFSLLEDLDEVFYGTVKGESKMHIYADARNPLPLQKSIDSSSKKVTNVEDERKSPGTPLFDSEEGVLERSLLFPTTVAAVNPELLEEPPALSFLYKDLYAEAVGEKTKDDTPSDEESGNSNASFPSRNSDTDDGTGIYFEKYILKDELPSKAIRPQKDHIPGDEPFSRAISVQSSEDKHKQGSGDVLCVQTGVLMERDVVEREKIQVDSNIRATICKPMHAIPFGGKEILSGARSDITEQGEEENVPVETTEESPEQSSYQVRSQPVDHQGTVYQEAASNKQEEQHEITAIPGIEKYVPYARTPVEDSEDDQYMQGNLSHLPTIQQTEKPDLPKEEQHPDVYEDLAESMDYDVITQEELLQDEISSQFTHEELLFEDRDSFEHIGDNYEFVNEPEQRTPVELEDSGFVVMYPEKSATNIPQIESPQRELKKVQADTYCYHCKCPISAIDKLFGEHKDHEVTTLDDAATKMKDHLGELLIALEEKSMKIEAFVGDIESLFNSVEENCKKNAELLEKQNEEMLKNVVAQYDEKSDNFEEVKKMKMEYLYEQMVHFQQTVDSAKETLETTVKEMEELDGFAFLNSSKELNKRLLSAMDTTLSLEKVPSAFSLFEHYADSPGQTNQHSLKHVAVPQTPTVVPQEPNSATSTSIAVYWAVNDGDAIECFQVYCMEEPQASKDPGALVEEYRVTVKESHCILEDLEPDRCYSVWVMAVNGTGCSLPSEKAIFKTAPTVPTIKAEDCMVCWDMATVRWHVGSTSVESFTLEYCRQHSPEGEGLRSFAGIKRPELKVSLEPNVNYFFYLRAVNPFGTSEQSEAALISTKGTRFRLLSDTAHPALQISSNATVVHLPEKAKFTGFASVLGELLPARGCHYWETVVSACRSYRIGICYEATSRSSILGLSDTSWCMRCCPTQTSFLYRFLHTGVVSDVHVTDHPARIGILLDYSSGRLLFFNAERGLVLFTIRHKFTDAAYPAFALEKAGALTLHTGMEPPEFVKHG